MLCSVPGPWQNGTRDLAIGLFFLSQTALGMVGNSAMFVCFIIADFSGIKAKPTDLIVKHLTLANFIVLCRGIPQTNAAFHQTYYLDFVSCKLILYFHRVARGISLGSTSLLSFFQAMTISSNNSKLAQFKGIAPRLISSSLGMCWALQLLVYVCIPVYTTDIWVGKNDTGIKDFGFCVIMIPGKVIGILNTILLTSNDVIFLGMMMWAGGYMVFILHKHKHRVQHIHRSLSPRSSPETRATQNIFTLVSIFVFFYVTSIVFTSYLSVIEETRRLSNVGVAMTACFPAFCPFLLIRHHTPLFRLYFRHWFTMLV